MASNLNAKSHRPHGFFPTDPHAVEALRLWLRRTCPAVLREPWLDPCGGYGALLAGLVPQHLRYAIELQPRLRDELARRVDADKLTIGSGLSPLTWPRSRTADRIPPHVVENPPFDSPTMTAFVAAALEHRRNWAEGVTVCVLALSTWWHSEAACAVFARYEMPHDLLALGFRITCDGSGVGDMRSHDWLVWHPSHSSLVTSSTRMTLLTKPEVSGAVIAEHRRLSAIGGIA